ncbi:MAG: hypothetical protein AAF773_00755 [Cyanobacteria bacterium P01_D01_bin.115]
MATNFRAFGDFTVSDPTNGELYEIRGNTLNFSSELDTEDILAFPTGGTSELQIFDTVLNSTTWTLTLTTGNVQKDTLQLVFRKRFVTPGAALSLPFKQIVTVPASPGPYTVTVAGFTEDEDVMAKVLRSGTNSGGDLRLERIANADAGTITSGQFAVDATTLTFHSDQAGATVAIHGFRDNTPSESLGGANTSDELGTLRFFGLMKPKVLATPLNLYVPSLAFTEGTEFATDQDDLTLGLTANTVAPYTNPFVIW